VPEAVISAITVAVSSPSTFSFVALLTLVVILAASGWVFLVLTRQWTANRPLQALREWARDRRFIVQLRPLDPQVELLLVNAGHTLVRLSTFDRAGFPRLMWNLLIMETKQARGPAGLRPANAAASFLDLFSMNGYPSLLPPERFVAFAVDSMDARTIAASPARGLLPADIGLLVHGPYVTLDFSTRPFDAIEFDRMLAILKQVIEHTAPRESVPSDVE
jgi:hypothetical protein